MGGIRALLLQSLHPLAMAASDPRQLRWVHVAEELGADGVPRNEAGLPEELDRFRPELAGTPAARETARFLLLLLPYLPLTEAVVVRTAGTLAARTIRWAVPPPP